MKKAFFASILIILSPTLDAIAQQRTLLGSVEFVDENGQNPRPAPGVYVRVKGLGLQDDTDDRGYFALSLTDNLQPGTSITLEVDYANYRIYKPFRGDYTLLADATKPLLIQLAPTGAVVFLSPNQIQNLIQEGVLASLMEFIHPSDKKDNSSLARLWNEWIRQNGFDPELADSMYQAWIEDELKQSNDNQDLGLARFARFQFREASSSFKQSAAQSEKVLTRVLNELAHKTSIRDSLGNQLINAYRSQGRAHYYAFDFDAAIEAYQQAQRWADTLSYAYDLARIQNDIGFVLLEQGTRAQGTESLILLDSTISILQQQIRGENHKDLQPQIWARTQDILGIAFREKSTRLSNEDSSILIQQAISAHQSALEVFTRDEYPHEWAVVQNNLGNALTDQGIRTESKDAILLLKQAATAFRGALRIFSKEDSSLKWATVQNNLGNVLLELGIHIKNETNREFLAEAVIAYQAALEVRTKEALPQDWAMTTNNLGNTFAASATRNKSNESIPLLEQSIAAYQAALEVRTKEALPQDWAATQNNLGDVLRKLALRVSSGSIPFLEQSIAAYQTALEVRTKEALPQDWAATQNNLGAALRNLGLRQRGPEGLQRLEEAVTAYQAALEVRTKEALPQDWATTQNNLGNALGNLGMLKQGQERKDLLEEAEIAFREALQVRTKEALPQDWATTENNRANVLRSLATESEEKERQIYLLQEVASIYRSILKIRTEESLPQQWASTQNNLGVVLNDLGMRTSDTLGIRHLEEAEIAFREALQVRTKEALPQDWATTQFNLGIALRSQGFLYKGVQGLQLVNRASSAFKQALTVRTRDALPRSWKITHSTLGTLFALKAHFFRQEMGYEQTIQSVDTSIVMFARVDTPPSYFRYWLSRILNTLSREWAEEGTHLQQALVYSEHSLTLKPNDAHFLDTLAEIYLRSGQYEDAIETNKLAYQHAQSLPSDNKNLLNLIVERSLRIESAAQRE